MGSREIAKHLSLRKPLPLRRVLDFTNFIKRFLFFPHRKSAYLHPFPHQGLSLAKQTFNPFLLKNLFIISNLALNQAVYDLHSKKLYRSLIIR